MRIFVPVDESQHTRHVIDFLLDHEAFFGEKPEFEFANVQYSVPENLIRLFGVEEVKRYYLEMGKDVFDKLGRETDVHRLGGTDKVLYGDIDRCLAEEVEKFAPDLIVMGTRGLNPVKGLMLGSVSNGLLARTRTPMLLIRDKSTLPTNAMRVGILVDGSDYGAAAAEFVLKHRAFFGNNARFTAVHCAEPVPYPFAPNPASPLVPVLSRAEIDDAQRRAFDDAIRPTLEPFEKANVPLATEYLTGNPDQQLAEYANACLDMIVMGSHGYGNFTAAVLGSTAMHVAAATTLPVLVVRRPKG